MAISHPENDNYVYSEAMKANIRLRWLGNVGLQVDEHGGILVIDPFLPRLLSVYVSVGVKTPQLLEIGYGETFNTGISR